MAGGEDKKTARSGSAGPRSAAEGERGESIDKPAPKASWTDTHAVVTAPDDAAANAVTAAGGRRGGMTPAGGPGKFAKSGDVVASRDPDIARPPPWWKRLRTDPPFPMRMLLGGAMVGIVMFIWWFVTHGEVYARMVSPSVLPSPGEVIDSIGKMGERHLGDAIFDTLQRVLIGVVTAAVVGVTLGVIAGSIRSVSAALGPIVIFLRSVPMAALLFLTLLLFGGIGEKQKTMFIFLAVVPFVFSDTIKAVAIVPERYVETAQTLGASRFQIIWKVLIPLAIPDVITSLRFQFGLALGYITLAESAGQEGGLGAMIEASNRQGPREHVILLLFIIAFIAYGIDLILRTLQRGAFRWRRDL